jgi:type IV secretory pathway component VirB8
MTTQADKQKQNKKRELKRKHMHETEHMQEEAARKKRAHTEATIAICVLLFFVPFMVTGVIFWPAK